MRAHAQHAQHTCTCTCHACTCTTCTTCTWHACTCTTCTCTAHPHVFSSMPPSPTHAMPCPPPSQAAIEEASAGVGRPRLLPGTGSSSSRARVRHGFVAQSRKGSVHGMLASRPRFPVRGTIPCTPPVHGTQPNGVHANASRRSSVGLPHVRTLNNITEATTDANDSPLVMAPAKRAGGT
jgi:hypothetical protein